MTSPVKAPHEAPSLDPSDWDGYRRAAHELLDACIDHLEGVRERPWRPWPADAGSRLALGPADEPVDIESVAREMVEHVLPFGSGNTHPAFFGWVQGTGNAAALLAEIVAGTMNSNCGGRDHGAVYVERDVVRWCREAFGLPDEASGVLVSGTSQATIIALAVARQRALGASSRRAGIHGGPRLTLYAGRHVHSSVAKAAELLGLGSDALRLLPLGAGGGMDLAALAEQVELDSGDGCAPFCVVATAGSVDQGAFDDLRALAAFCAERSLWFHVDGAFGAWLRLADDPWSRLTDGIERADSIALDFHKWMAVQYDCGLVLVREERLHREAFATRPAYLTSQRAGLGGGEPWFCDYGTELSRGFRALKVWSTLRAFGRRQLGASISGNCRLAGYLAELVSAAPDLELAAPVVSNVCCFGAAAALGSHAQRSAWNESVVAALQLAGRAVFSTTVVDGVTVARAAITNHRTRAHDIEDAVAGFRARLGAVRRGGAGA